MVDTLHNYFVASITGITRFPSKINQTPRNGQIKWTQTDTNKLQNESKNKIFTSNARWSFAVSFVYTGVHNKSAEDDANHSLLEIKRINLK